MNDSIVLLNMKRKTSLLCMHHLSGHQLSCTHLCFLSLTPVLPATHLTILHVRLSVLFSMSRVTCVDFTDDSSMLAAGLQNSNIRVWSLTPNKLRGMKSTMELEIIDKEAGRVSDVSCFLLWRCCVVSQNSCVSYLYPDLFPCMIWMPTFSAYKKQKTKKKIYKYF